MGQFAKIGISLSSFLLVADVAFGCFDCPSDAFAADEPAGPEPYLAVLVTDPRLDRTIAKLKVDFEVEVPEVNRFRCIVDREEELLWKLRCREPGKSAEYVRKLVCGGQARPKRYVGEGPMGLPSIVLDFECRIRNQS